MGYAGVFAHGFDEDIYRHLTVFTCVDHIKSLVLSSCMIKSERYQDLAQQMRTLV